MRSETIVKLTPSRNPEVSPISLHLNGKPSDVTDRIRTVIETVQKMAREQGPKDLEFICDEEPEKKLSIASIDDLLKCHVEIESNNNFNTAAGLASSSSGLSCLGIALAHLYGLQQSADFDFSVLARLGSGSAVRSVYGGFVKWNKGWNTEQRKSVEEGDEEVLNTVSSRSIAQQVILEDPTSLDFWLDNLSIQVCVVKPEEDQFETKKISSTKGMQLTMQTS